MAARFHIPALMRVLERHLGDVAVYSGMYAAASVGAVFVLAEAETPWRVLTGSAFATVGVYLLDRIKLRDRDLDPADLAAKPRRHGYLRSHGFLFRALAIACVVIATVLLTTQRWWLGFLPATGAGAVLLYTRGQSHGERPKDRVLVKNAVVAAAIVILAGLSLLGLKPETPLPSLIVSLGWLGAVVLGDAALSDLDDRESDEKFGTRTLPNTIGVKRTWLIALAVQSLAGVVLLVTQEARATTLILALGVPLSTAMLWALGPKSVRDLIDLRLPILVALAIGMS